MELKNYSQDVQNLIAEIQANRGKKPGTVMKACDKLEEIGGRLSDNALLGFVYFSKGETYYLLNDAGNFYNQMIKCLAPMESVHEWGYLAMANNMLGIVSLNRGNAPYALDYYIKAINICRDYGLPDIEWIIHQNLGSLYLNIEEYNKAINHMETALNYINEHRNIENYPESYMSILLGLGRAYLRLEKNTSALEIEKKLKSRCMPFLQETDKITVYCYFARLHQTLGETDAAEYWINQVNEKTTVNMPIMDSFDDFYDYMEMLLSVEKYDDFFAIYNLVDEMTKRTAIKNLEKKLLTLKIRYFRRTGQIEEYKISSVLFFELSEFMEKENKQLVSNMIVMRNSYMELTQINRRVERENSYLQKKSETDPLTGLNNRLKLNDYSVKAFEKAKKNRSSIAVEILDIDYFKQYNDNYGHQKGDECIKAIAKILLEMSRKNQVFTARYGGDEFLIIYEGLDQAQVEEKARWLKEEIFKLNYEHKFSLIDERVTISQGIGYGMPSSGQNFYRYLQGADNMLYKVKQKGRNNYMISQVD